MKMFYVYCAGERDHWYGQFMYRHFAACCPGRLAPQSAWQAMTSYEPDATADASANSATIHGG